LALSPLASGDFAPAAPGVLVTSAVAFVALAIARPAPTGPAHAIWIASVALAATLAGAAVGTLRLEAIDAGAFHGQVGRRATVRGFVTAVPHRSGGEVIVRVETGEGRLAVEAPGPVPDLPTGAEIVAEGTIAEPRPWETGYLRRLGIAEALSADRVRPTGRTRGGPAGLIDRVRGRAERALGRGTPEAQAALLRGFLLGEDDRIEELLGAFPIHRLVFAAPGSDAVREARAVGIRTTPIAAGSAIESGGLSLESLWPPRPVLDEPPAADPNRSAIVLLARWRRFSILLTADAEAEAVPLDPGPVDVLKVAHHGSDDAGLDALLDRTSPRLAVISVGADNPYGHPTAETLSTLAEHRIPTLRTDRGGDVTIDVSARGWAVRSGD
jgi:hypothetical protein